ncbi:alpha/beta hydrolase family protein [Aporhodopirellula aestuarii]|uniref:Prolyl oligopeptidase family serine peptidase n=1 Tax=Aporhodopirellula aestuarii TaxID=2950107 RepID=A0ABT0U890_9BACT|nr:prolyl oligopeptidase family serine peptidase [Aporhodopirellula aestuarii]MCM2373096.1 prolyl oligopeptidase family serine peptidase [Aporhodopirellula aestuarii]
MPTPPIIVRCGKCQQRMQVVPLATDSKVTCVGCGAVLRIAGTNRSATHSPLQSDPAPQQSPRPQTPPRQPPQPTFHNPQPAAFTTHPQVRSPVPASRGAAPKNGIPKWIFFLIGGVVLIPIVCCGVLALAFSWRVNSGKPVPIAVSLKAALPPHQFPPLGAPEETYPSGVKRYFIRFASNPDLPGHTMQMCVFVPPGEHATHSLPCVLIAPAGTPMLHGVTLEENDSYDDETLPYAEAGFVVVQYSLDGGLPAGSENADEDDMTALIGKAYPAFKASGAGVVNGRNAIEFALASLKMVDPQKISCAGHSSAGSLSLLLAAHDHRIHRCVAYAAAYDLESRMGEMTSNIVVRTIFPGINEFIIETSPMNHVDKLDCPVMIFHARDDSNVPFSDAEAFVSRLKSAGKDVTFETTPTGDHYESMINPGIPTAIEWLKTR